MPSPPSRLYINITTVVLVCLTACKHISLTRWLVTDDFQHLPKLVVIPLWNGLSRHILVDVIQSILQSFLCDGIVLVNLAVRTLSGLLFQ